MSMTFTEVREPPVRWQVEWELCDIAAEATGTVGEAIAFALKKNWGQERREH